MTSPKSSPTPETTPVTTPPTVSENSTKVADDPNVAVKYAGLAAIIKGSTFPLILTILAVFPLALGIGAVRLKAASAVIADHIETDDEPDDAPAPNPRLIDRRLGDQQFLERRYEVAMQYYRSLGNADSERLPPELLYRIGLCQEGLGMWDEALESFSAVSRATDDTILRAASDFGQARLQLRQNTPDKAITLLRSLEVSRGSRRSLPKNMSQEIAFLFPIALAHDVISKSTVVTTEKTGQISELFIWSLEAALGWSLEPTHIDDSVTDADSPSNTFACRVVAPAGKAAHSQPVEKIVAEMHCLEQPLRTVAERLAKECGWVVDWTDLTQDPALERPITFVTENRPVCLTLTAISSELKSTWTIENTRLTFKRANAEGVQTRRMIVHTLESMMNWNPNQRHVAHCRFVLAQFAQVEGNLLKAASLYSSLSGRDSSNLSIRSAFNAGNLYFQLGDLARACVQLDYVASGATRNEMHTSTLILLGRILLDRGETQEAVFNFRRATEAKNQPQLQAHAAAYLGMALLMQEKYQAAAEAFLTNRFQFEGETIPRNAAALVNALARWNVLKAEQQESETSFLYRALVSVKADPDALGQMFGQTGMLLIGRAYAALGFDDQMAELYHRMLSNGVTENIQIELTYSLAVFEKTNGRAEAAKEMWLKLLACPSERWVNRARMQLAEIALNEKQPEECLRLCDSFENSVGVLRSDLQKLMGRAYEQMGDEVSAARCYAGQTVKP